MPLSFTLSFPIVSYLHQPSLILSPPFLFYSLLNLPFLLLLKRTPGSMPDLGFSTKIFFMCIPKNLFEFGSKFPNDTSSYNYHVQVNAKVLTPTLEVSLHFLKSQQRLSARGPPSQVAKGIQISLQVRTS